MTATMITKDMTIKDVLEQLQKEQTGLETRLKEVHEDVNKILSLTGRNLIVEESGKAHIEPLMPVPQVPPITGRKTLADYIIEVLKNNKKPMKSDEIAKAVLNAGYKGRGNKRPTIDSLVLTVRQTINGDQKKKFKRVSRGSYSTR